MRPSQVPQPALGLGRESSLLLGRGCVPAPSSMRVPGSRRDPGRCSSRPLLPLVGADSKFLALGALRVECSFSWFLSGGL